MTDLKALMNNTDDGTQAWHEERRRGIGGSDAACVLGLKPYGRTREALWKLKTGRAEPFAGNDATAYGSILEPYIFEWLTERAEDRPSVYRPFRDLKRSDKQHVHPEREWMRANVDGLVADDGILEIKTKKHIPDGVHPFDYPQVQHYLETLGRDVAYYVVFEVPFDRSCALHIAEHFVSEADLDAYWRWMVEQSAPPHIEIVERDPDYIERLVCCEQKFWEYVESDEPPPELIPEGEEHVNDERLAELLDRYGRARARIQSARQTDTYQQAERDKERAKEEAKEYLQTYDAKKVVLPNGDYAVWNSRGYWMLKPKKREATDDTGDLPF